MPAKIVSHAPLRRRLPTDERKREIVSTVVALAYKQGPDTITTQAIADRIGITQGAIFRHFPDKESIWLAVFDWLSKSLGAALTAAIAGVNSPLAKIERMFIAHVAFIAAHPGVARIMFHELQYPGNTPVRAQVRTLISAYRKRLASLFIQARAQNELPAGLNVTLAPVLFIGAVQGLVIQASLAGDETEMVEQARQLLPLLLHGYCGRDPKPHSSRPA
jgi:Transcriptional regulator